MSRTLHHREETWEAQGTGTAIAPVVGEVVAGTSNWGVNFNCVSNPRIGPFKGSLVSTVVPDISNVLEANLKGSLEAAISKTKERIIRALEDEKWDWRTVEGMVEDAGLSPGAVEYILESDPVTFIRSRVPDKNGRALYTTRDHYALKRPELTRGHWWKLLLTFVGLLLTTVGALGCLTSIAANDQPQLVILSIPAQRAWLIAILGGAVGGLARALYQFLVDNYAFHYLRIAKHSSPWAMKVYGFKDDKDMEDDYDPLESWQLFFVKPLVGATIGLLFALAVDLGLLGLGDIEGDKRFMRLVVTAGLAGLFAENVLQRLEGLLPNPR